MPPADGNGEALRRTRRDHLEALSSRRLRLPQLIPADVEPEYVQLLGDAVADR